MITIELVDAETISRSTHRFFFQLQGLIARYKPQKRAENNALLQRLSEALGQGLPVESWEPDLRRRLLVVGSALGREALLDGARAESPQEAAARAQWLCSIGAVAGNGLDARTKLQPYGLLVMAHLACGADGIDDPSCLLAGIVKGGSPLGLAESELAVQAKLTLLHFYGREEFLSRLGADTIETLRAWLQELSASDLPPALLKGARRVLEPAVPSAREAVPSQVPPMAPPAPPRPADTANLPAPRFFSLPPDMREEFPLDTARKLVALGSRAPLSPLTAKQLQSLQPSSDAAQVARALYFASRDLWNACCSGRGNAELLQLAQDAALSAFHLSGRAGQERERSGALAQWLATRMADYTGTADPLAILQDCLVLCRHLGVRPAEMRLKAAIVECYAAECLRLEAEGESARAVELLADARAALVQLHGQLVEGASNRGLPQDDAERSAWQTLSARLGPIDTGRGAEHTILSDPDFRKVATRGIYSEMFEFVESRLGAIRDMLQQRLDVRLSTEHLMEPSGKIFNIQAPRARQLDGDFVAACELLKRGEDARAAEAFGRLATRLKGHPRDICINYQAYAEARQDHRVDARDLLKRLMDAGFTQASAYWNHACCLGTSQGSQQLETLVLGLGRAPHRRLLHGAIFLGLMLEDERLSQWLCRMTLVEALLYQYYLSYGNLSEEEKETAILRLNKYAKEGEPAMPDPLSRNLQPRAAAAFFNAMLDRRQPETVEFWLRCREPIGRKDMEYWELKVDFLDRVRRMPEAAEAFVEELEVRLAMLRARGGGKTPDPLLMSTKARVRRWLELCTRPELRREGSRIYCLVSEHDARYQTDLVPPVKSIQDHYAQSPRQETAPPALRDLGAVLTSAWTVLRQKLHEVSDLPIVRPTLEDLAGALRQGGRNSSAQALGNLFAQWERCNLRGGKTAAEGALREAQNALAQLRGALQRELEKDQWTLACSALERFDAVNDRLARHLQIVPILAVEPAFGPIAEIDPSSVRTSLVARIAAREGDASARLTGATAKLDDQTTTLELRDRLDLMPVIVGPGQSAVLSFLVNDPKLFQTPRAAEIELSYEYAGAIFRGAAGRIATEPRRCPELPAGAPYVFNRALLPEELVSHFVGRAAEQSEILASIGSGQQRLLYVEGVRGVGKSSLLRKVELEIRNRSLPVLPVYCSAASLASCEKAGSILFNIFAEVRQALASIGVELALPDEQRCIDNAHAAYSGFIDTLRRALPESRVAVLLDDFQVLVEAGRRAMQNSPVLANGIIAIFNLLRDQATPAARLLWVLSGHRALREFRSMLPGVILWKSLKPLAVDFVDAATAGEILTAPLAGTGVRVAPETLARVAALSAGHPDVIQEMGHGMYERMRSESRDVMTPEDADAAADRIASQPDTFATTWYPVAELPQEQQMLMASLVNAVKVGEKIQAHRLDASGQLSPVLQGALDELAARKILTLYPDGAIGVRAPVLDMWLHKVLPTLSKGGAWGVHGSAAVFIDVANLTARSGQPYVSGLDTAMGEAGTPGKFDLETVIAEIEGYVHEMTPGPIVARWAVNYPTGTPAVSACNNKNYLTKNIPPELARKRDADDVTLQGQLWHVADNNPTVNHFTLVTGDIDYSNTIQRLLDQGKFVHVLSRRKSLHGKYERLEQTYRGHLTVSALEDVLERRAGKK